MKTKLIFAFAFLLSGALSLVAQNGTTAAGMKYDITSPGTGVQLEPGKTFMIHADVSTADGTQVFSSREMGTPMSGVIGKEENDEERSISEILVQLKKGGTCQVEMPKESLDDSNPMKKNMKDGESVVVRIELVDVLDAGPDGAKLLQGIAKENGADAAFQAFDELQKSNPQGYVFQEWGMNVAGYELLQASNPDGAIALFIMNTRLYPQSWNAQDSLGDGYAAKGDKEKAKAAYEAALKLNPNFTASKEKLEKL